MQLTFFYVDIGIQGGPGLEPQKLSKIKVYAVVIESLGLQFAKMKNGGAALLHWIRQILRKHLNRWQRERRSNS